MDWQSQLVSIFFIVSEIFDEGVSLNVINNSNYSSRLNDAEVLTIFFFGLLSGHKDIKSIYWHTRNHLPGWFPELRGYEAYNNRLSKLADILPIILEALLKRCSVMKNCELHRLIDSFPIILAKSKRSQNAKVAPGLADKGYCASRGEYYYGVKVHVIGISRENSIPIPEIVQVTPASTHDLTLLKTVGRHCFGIDLYADKEFQINMKEENRVNIITPVKKPKERDLSMFEKMDSAFVSKIRQPIESLFNWLNEQTGIQRASKVRSANGLIAHIFGRLSSAVFAMAFKWGFNF